jgi:hypothetical protein
VGISCGYAIKSDGSGGGVRLVALWHLNGYYSGQLEHILKTANILSCLGSWQAEILEIVEQLPPFGPCGDRFYRLFY